MSLFAIDAALLSPKEPTTPARGAAAVAGATPAAPALAESQRQAIASNVTGSIEHHAAPLCSPNGREADDAWRAFLPSLVQAAINRGHVRAAAMLHETAMTHLIGSEPGLLQARALLDRCAASDSMLQRRQIKGEAVVVSSVTESHPGEPRFVVGIEWHEMGHEEVQAFVQAELTDGAQAEMRNFLTESLRNSDVLLDLDPGVGAVSLTALSGASGAVKVEAVTADATLYAMLQRNLEGSGYAARARTVHGTAERAANAFTPGKRAIVHLGRVPVASIAGALKRWASGSIAVAWDTTTPAANQIASTLLAAGLSSFVLAIQGGETELVPWQAGQGATCAFALSKKFMSSIEEEGK